MFLILPAVRFTIGLSTYMKQHFSSKIFCVYYICFNYELDLKVYWKFDAVVGDLRVYEASTRTTKSPLKKNVVLGNSYFGPPLRRKSH